MTKEYTIKIYEVNCFFHCCSKVCNSNCTYD